MKEVQPIRSEAEIERMKNELLKGGYRDYLLFAMGINTGLRVSDLLSLRVEDVRGIDFLNLKEQKTGKRRRVDLRAVRAQIDAYTESAAPDAFLFASRKGDNKPISRVQAYRILQGAASRAGLEEIGTHTMRKTFGYHFYKRYGDVVALQKLLNHASPTVTLRYIGIEQDQIDELTADFSL